MRIANALREEIESEALAATGLRQDVLARRFGVSRQPVRAALAVLQGEGLIVKGGDRRHHLAEPDGATDDELLAVRELLECQALRRSLPRLEPLDLLEARQAEERIALDSEPARIEEHDVAFHQALYRRCGNARLLALIEQLRREDRRRYIAQVANQAIRAAMHDDHAAILAAAEAGDPTAALAALRRHLRLTEGERK